MDVIYAYLDTMFSPYASSPRLDAAKEELRGMMEDAYSARVAQGNSHNEAVGAVITEFGNLDELAEVLGISTELNRVNSAHDDARNATSPGSAAPDSDDAAARGANPGSAHAPRTAPSDARPGAFAANGRAASRTPPPKAPKADSTTGSAASDFTATPTRRRANRADPPTTGASGGAADGKTETGTRSRAPESTSSRPSSGPSSQPSTFCGVSSGTLGAFRGLFGPSPDFSSAPQ